MLCRSDLADTNPPPPPLHLSSLCDVIFIQLFYNKIPGTKKSWLIEWKFCWDVQKVSLTKLVLEYQIPATNPSDTPSPLIILSMTSQTQIRLQPKKPNPWFAFGSLTYLRGRENS